MPRRPRLAAGDLAYHVLNRRVGQLPLFDEPADYAAFEKILAEAHARQRKVDRKGKGVRNHSPARGSPACSTPPTPYRSPLARSDGYTSDFTVD